MSYWITAGSLGLACGMTNVVGLFVPVLVIIGRPLSLGAGITGCLFSMDGSAGTAGTMGLAFSLLDGNGGRDGLLSAPGKVICLPALSIPLLRPALPLSKLSTELGAAWATGTGVLFPWFKPA